nr:hypothetical transcript [Hymenolepis microstoma]
MFETGVYDRLTSKWCTLGNVYSYGKKVYNPTIDFKLLWPHCMSYSTSSTVLTSPYLFLYPCVCLFYICESLFCSLLSRLFVTLMFLSSVKPEVN